MPIDPERCDDFDPFSVPTLELLCRELNASDAAILCDTEQRGGNTSLSDYKSTSLKRHVDTFMRFLQPLEESLRLQRIEQRG